MDQSDESMLEAESGEADEKYGLLRGYGRKTVHNYTTVGGTALQVAAADPTRIQLRVRNNGGATAYLGTDNTVTVANGYALPAGAELVDEASVDAWWAITAAAGDIRTVEVV